MDDRKAAEILSGNTEQKIPPHGCWQCKQEFDDMPREQRKELFTAMMDEGVPFDTLSIIRGDLKGLDMEAARKRGQDWVDDVFDVSHQTHQPETWV